MSYMSISEDCCYCPYLARCLEDHWVCPYETGRDPYNDDSDGVNYGYLSY